MHITITPVLSVLVLILPFEGSHARILPLSFTQEIHHIHPPRPQSLLLYPPSPDPTDLEESNSNSNSNSDPSPQLQKRNLHLHLPTFISPPEPPSDSSLIPDSTKKEDDHIPDPPLRHEAGDLKGLKTYTYASRATVPHAVLEKVRDVDWVTRFGKTEEEMAAEGERRRRGREWEGRLRRDRERGRGRG